MWQFSTETVINNAVGVIRAINDSYVLFVRQRGYLRGDFDLGTRRQFVISGLKHVKNFFSWMTEFEKGSKGSGPRFMIGFGIILEVDGPPRSVDTEMEACHVLFWDSFKALCQYDFRSSGNRNSLSEFILCAVFPFT